MTLDLACSGEQSCAYPTFEADVLNQNQSMDGNLTRFLDAYQANNSPYSTSLRPPTQHTHGLSNAPNHDSAVVANSDSPVFVRAGIPDETLTAIVNTFFECCHNQPYSFFHEANFRSRLPDQDVPTYLILAVMATATRFCLHPYFSGRAFEASADFADRAWKCIVSDDFKGGSATDLSTVQTMALLGLFDFTGMSRVH